MELMMSGQTTTCPDTDYPTTDAVLNAGLHELRIMAERTSAGATILLDGKRWLGLTQLRIEMDGGPLVKVHATMHARINGRWDHLKAESIALSNAEPSLHLLFSLRYVLREALETMSAEAIAATAGGVTAKAVLNFVSGDTTVPNDADREAFERFVAQWEARAAAEAGEGAPS